MRIRLNLIGAIILLTGLGSAVFVYLTADSGPGGAAGYEVSGDNVYPLSPENSRMYAHDLELYGGRAAVLANEFRYWFVGLWHGKKLALTVACIAVFISACLFFVARHSSSDLPARVQNENNRRGKYFNP